MYFCFVLFCDPVSLKRAVCVTMGLELSMGALYEITQVLAVASHYHSLAVANSLLQLG